MPFLLIAVIVAIIIMGLAIFVNIAQPENKDLNTGGKVYNKKHDHSCNCFTHEDRIRLNLILIKLEKIMANLDDLLAAVNDESTVDDSIIALLNGISQQLKDALSGTVLPAPVQAKVDAVFAAVKANAQKVSDAVTANTPVAPPAPADSGVSG